MGSRLMLLSITLLSLGCASYRTTTTPRTAVEQALLSQSAESTLERLAIPELAGKSFFVSPDLFEAIDGKYVLAQINQKLLAAGGKAGGQKTADILVYPSVANAAIDDRSIFLGIPEFPFAIPGVGAITVPELALFKLATQRGRNRMNVYGHYNTGELAFRTETASTERSYSRWIILFLITFRSTDLVAPF